jgi:hypothetical protein
MEKVSVNRQFCFDGAADCGAGAGGATVWLLGATTCSVAIITGAVAHGSQTGSATTIGETGAHLLWCLAKSLWKRPPFGFDQMPHELQPLLW